MSLEDTLQLPVGLKSIINTHLFTKRWSEMKGKKITSVIQVSPGCHKETQEFLLKRDNRVY